VVIGSFDAEQPAMLQNNNAVDSVTQAINLITNLPDHRYSRGKSSRRRAGGGGGSAAGIPCSARISFSREIASTSASYVVATFRDRPTAQLLPLAPYPRGRLKFAGSGQMARRSISI
jgi:hypothetical protein